MFFPGIIGCVDGGHVELKAVSKNIERNYVNRKGTHSKNVQFVSYFKERYIFNFIHFKMIPCVFFRFVTRI